MYNKFPLAIVITALLALVLSSCAGKETTEEITKVPETVEPIVVGPIVEVEEVLPEPEVTGPSYNERDALLQVDTFYFPFDSAVISSASNGALDTHAEEILAKLEQNSNVVVNVEGHTDERGTIEYNNALGYRRAEAVSSYLQGKGVPAANIETVSYGELRPVAEGSDETSWALNRRVILDY